MPPLPLSHFKPQFGPTFGIFVPSFVPEWWKIGAPERIRTSGLGLSRQDGRNSAFQRVWRAVVERLEFSANHGGMMSLARRFVTLCGEESAPLVVGWRCPISFRYQTFFSSFGRRRTCIRSSEAHRPSSTQRARPCLRLVYLDLLNSCIPLSAIPTDSGSAHKKLRRDF
jgi:hypothetical protein